MPLIIVETSAAREILRTVNKIKYTPTINLASNQRVASFKLNWTNLTHTLLNLCIDISIRLNWRGIANIYRYFANCAKWISTELKKKKISSTNKGHAEIDHGYRYSLFERKNNTVSSKIIVSNRWLIFDIEYIVLINLTSITRYNVYIFIGKIYP